VPMGRSQAGANVRATKLGAKALPGQAYPGGGGGQATQPWMPQKPNQATQPWMPQKPNQFQDYGGWRDMPLPNRGGGGQATQPGFPSRPGGMQGPGGWRDMPMPNRGGGGGRDATFLPTKPLPPRPRGYFGGGPEGMAQRQAYQQQRADSIQGPLPQHLMRMMQMQQAQRRMQQAAMMRMMSQQQGMMGGGNYF
jgi:hypothetical protein